MVHSALKVVWFRLNFSNFVGILQTVVFLSDCNCTKTVFSMLLQHLTHMHDVEEFSLH